MIGITPLVSIIIPLYNTENYIGQCLDSIQAQSYKNLEIIIVDDGSTDRSKSICLSHALKDERIHVVTQNNSGVVRAREKGIKISRGDYLCFVDSDDTIKPRMVEVMLQSIITNQSDAAVQIKHTIFYEANYKVTMTSSECLKKLCLLKFPTAMWAYMYSASIAKRIMVNPQIHFFEDFLFNYIYMCSSTKISVVEQSYYNYRVNPESINHSALNEKKLSCLKIYDLLCDLKLNEKNDAELQFFRSHCLIAMVIAAAKLDKCSKKVCRQLNTEAKYMQKAVLNSLYVPAKYRIIIILMSYFPRLTLKGISIVVQKNNR